MRINFRIKQGLGDNAQFSIVLKHFRHYYPDSFISIQSPWGTEDIYRDLVDEWQPIRYPWQNKGFDKSVYIHFAHPEYEWDSLPSSKATQCLEIEMKSHGFDMPPIPELFTYNVVSTDEQKNKVGEWLETLPENKGIVFIHPYGNSSPEDKNLDLQSWIGFYNKAKELGYLPITLNWANPEWGIERFFRNVEFRGDNITFSDAGQIKELLNVGTLLIGIDSGIEHIATVSDCPTAVVWKNHHPLYCFDLSENESLKHFLPDYLERSIETPEAREFFNECYNHSYFATHYHLFTELEGLLNDTSPN